MIQTNKTEIESEFVLSQYNMVKHESESDIAHFF